MYDSRVDHLANLIFALHIGQDSIMSTIELKRIVS